MAFKDSDYHRMPKTLCISCKRSTIIKTDITTVIQCHMMDRRMLRPVQFCNSYKDAHYADLADMKDIAYLIAPSTSMRPIGFVQPGTEEHKKLSHAPLPDDYD